MVRNYVHVGKMSEEDVLLLQLAWLWYYRFLGILIGLVLIALVISL